MSIRWSSIPLLLALCSPVALAAVDNEAGPMPAQTREANLGGFRYLVFETGHAKSDAMLPMIVGLHYSGAKPETMLEYFDGIDFPARIVLPQGTYPRREGFTWFPSGHAQLDATQQKAATLRAEENLSSFVGSVVEKYPTRSKPVVMGISYGGDLAFLLAIRHPGQFQAAFPVAARLLPDWMPRDNACKPGCPPIYAMHGDQDTTVPMAPSRHAAQQLRALGFNVQFQSYPGVAHDFDARMKQDFSDQARSLLAPKP